MIKVFADQNGLKELIVSGTTPEIVAKFAATISTLYMNMKDANEVGAELFKETFVAAVDAMFIDAEELDEYLEGKGKEALEEIKKHVDKIDDALKRLKDTVEGEA